MSDPKSPKTILEAAELCGELLKNIELQQIALGDCALKAARVARLLDDQELQKIFVFEAGGYPSDPDGVSPDVFALAIKAGRAFLKKEEKTGAVTQYIYPASIGWLEAQIKIIDASLAAARDPDVSISSANPHQIVYNPAGNTVERQSIRGEYLQCVDRLSQRRAFIYKFASETYYRLRLSGINDDVFIRNRDRVDALIGVLVPDAVQKFVAIYDNLASTNPEDWANAVHSCRRILQAIADAVFPATHPQQRGGKTIQLGESHYINRLVAFLEDHTQSDTYRAVVGSHLQFVGDRLDAVFAAAQKGSHSTVTREEAERYFIYTYLLAGDVLSLQT